MADEITPKEEEPVEPIQDVEPTQQLESIQEVETTQEAEPQQVQPTEEVEPTQDGEQTLDVQQVSQVTFDIPEEFESGGEEISGETSEGFEETPRKKKRKRIVTEIEGEEIPDEYDEEETIGEEYEEEFEGFEEEEESEEEFGEEEEVEEELEEETKGRIKFSERRNELLTLYQSTLNQYNIFKKRNSLLQRRMIEFYKKKKMDYVFKEADDSSAFLIKYHEKMELLNQVKLSEANTRSIIDTEVSKMMDHKDGKQQLLDYYFNTTLQLEQSTGTGLIYAKSGKVITDKEMQTFLTRQRNKWELYRITNLRFIKMKNVIAEKKEMLKALDTFGDLHLIHFEQLLVEYQILVDKFEERDDDLTKFRSRCVSAMQCLAHIREKAQDVFLTIMETREDLYRVCEERTECRERVNYYKQERDFVRIQLQELKEKSGLLTRNKLLLHMQKCIEDAEMKTDQLNTIKSTYEMNKSHLSALRKHLMVLSRRREDDI